MKKIISRIIVCVLAFSFVFSYPILLSKGMQQDEEITTVATTEEITTEITTEETTELEVKEEISEVETTTKKEITTVEASTTEASTKTENSNTTKSEPTTQKVVTTETSTEDSYSSGEWIKYTATAYCPCSYCCGKSDGITASGKKATPNHTIAVDKSQIPLGTKVEIKGYGIYVAEDTGGAIKGNKIDIYFSTHQEALNFGKRTIYIRIVD